MSKSEQEILEQIDQASESVNEGTSKFPSMSYEEGVKAALDWVVGDSPKPMED